MARSIDYVYNLSGLHWREVEVHVSLMVEIEDVVIWLIGGSFVVLDQHVSCGFPWSWSEVIEVLCP
jgi:hypothetical protein